MRTRKLALFLILVLLGPAFVVVIFEAPPTYAVEDFVLTPSHGPVGTRVNITGWVDKPGQRYYIYFATGDGNTGLGLIKSGKAPADSTSMSDFFIVPSCFGEPTGHLHVVQMQDESAIARNRNFSVETSIDMSMPGSAKAGDTVPINVTITGGYPSTDYSFDFRLVDEVIRKDLAHFLTQLTTDSRGTLSRIFYYPTLFYNGSSQPGSYSVVARVTSQSPFMWEVTTDITKIQSLQVQQRVNQQPKAQIVSISPNPAIVGQQVTFTGNGTDVDGNITAYQWASDINGTLSTSRIFSTANLMVGTHKISFQVRDNNMNWSAPDTQTLIVQSPPAKTPIAYIDSITPNPAGAGEKITFVGYGDESGGFIISYRWISSIDGWLSGASTFDTSSLSVGTHNISLEVQDNSNLWSNPVNASLIIGAINIPPAAVIDSILPSSIAAGEQVIFSGHGDDVDGAIEGYRWTSSIDGLLSTSSEFSISTLSVGVHTISFQVQDSSGAWSNVETIVLEVKEGTALFWLLPVVGSFAAVSGVISLIHFSRPPSSTEVKNNLQKQRNRETKREEKEKKKRKREIEKGKPFLDLKIDSPSIIMGATSYETKLRIRNVGSREAKDIAVTADSTPGLLLDTQPPIMPSLEPGGEYTLTIPFKANEQLKKGVYALRFEVRSRETWRQVRNCYARAIRIGLLSNAGKQDYAEQLKEWLKEKSYTCDELTSADHLVRCLLKYDLIILAPELELAQQWTRNLASFVENSQSLLAIEKMITSEEETLAKLLGYGEMRYEEFKSDEGLLRICDKQHFITRELVPEEKIALGQSWGNVCISKPTTGKSLAEQFIGNESKYDDVISALTINQFMEGKTAHLNFHAEQSLSELSPMLEKTFDWLLSEDILVQPKRWSSGLRTLKLVFGTLSELFQGIFKRGQQVKITQA